MTKADAKKYKDLNLNLDRIVPCIERNGGVGPVLEKKNEKEHHLRFKIEGNVFLIKIFPVAGGVFSLGKAAGYCPETFSRFADLIIGECVAPTPANLNVSLPKFSSEHVALILEFLIESGAQVESVDGGALCKMYRVAGALGDSLVVKHYNSGTLQLQGKYRQLATLVGDYLTSVLSLDEVLKAQSKMYEVDLTVQQVKDGLLTVIPAAHDVISEQVRMQLSSAFALAKIELPVEDYACVALPALRGLEGFLKDLLIKGNLHPAKQSTFSDYFRDGKLGTDQAAHITASGGQALREVIDACYAYYAAERHGIAHMSAPSTTSRIIDLATAREIVDRVFGLIEASSKRLSK